MLHRVAPAPLQDVLERLGDRLLDVGGWPLVLVADAVELALQAVHFLHSRLRVASNGVEQPQEQDDLAG